MQMNDIDLVNEQKNLMQKPKQNTIAGARTVTNLMPEQDKIKQPRAPRQVV
jgi:hypothetical protein